MLENARQMQWGPEVRQGVCFFFLGSVKLCCFTQPASEKWKILVPVLTVIVPVLAVMPCYMCCGPQSRAQRLALVHLGVTFAFSFF